MANAVRGNAITPKFKRCEKPMQFQLIITQGHVFINILQLHKNVFMTQTPQTTKAKQRIYKKYDFIQFQVHMVARDA